MATLGPVRDRAEQDAVLARLRARYEQALQLNRRDLRQWMRYAQLEYDSHNVDRARSIFERALAVDYTYIPLWLRYTQMEILMRQFDRARAIYERATTLLPREQKVWLSFLEMEELQDNIDACRHILERWSHSEDSVAWKTWFTFEKNNQGDAVRILWLWVSQSPSDLQAWLLLGKETDPRSAYSQAIDTDTLSPADRKELLRIWADYEHSRGEEARAKKLLEIAGVAPGTRAFANIPGDPESWWIEINAQSEQEDPTTLMQMFESAVERCKPSNNEHKTTEWRKYALLWLRYAIYTEKRGLPAAPIYEKALSNWPHDRFSSVTLWKAYSEFELRQNNLARARKIYGSALGKTRGHPRIYSNYIDLERRLLSTDKVRMLHSKYCEDHPHMASPWLEYASFEVSVEELERARKIYEYALQDLALENSYRVWVAWAEMEADAGEFDRARDVWNQTLSRQKTGDAVELWAQFAMFEISTGLGEEDDEVEENAVVRAREVFLRALKELSQNSERLRLYELFIQFEETYGSETTLQELQSKAPRTVVKTDDHGAEYLDYEFPEIEPSPISRLLANARKWAVNNASQ